MSDEIVVRNAVGHDVPEVRRILRTANEPCRAALPAEAFAAYLDMVLAIESRLGVADLIVAVNDRRVVGTVTYFPDATVEGWGCPPDHSGIRSMAVDPTAQRAGVGRILLDECRHRAVSSGAAGITLHTAHFLPEAVRLYERYGFVRRPDHDLQATQLMPLADASADYVALAYCLDLSR